MLLRQVCKQYSLRAVAKWMGTSKTSITRWLEANAPSPRAIQWSPVFEWLVAHGNKEGMALEAFRGFWVEDKDPQRRNDYLNQLTLTFGLAIKSCLKCQLEFTYRAAAIPWFKVTRNDGVEFIVRIAPRNGLPDALIISPSNTRIWVECTRMGVAAASRIISDSSVVPQAPVEKFLMRVENLDAVVEKL